MNFIASARSGKRQWQSYNATLLAAILSQRLNPVALCECFDDGLGLSVSMVQTRRRERRSGRAEGRQPTVSAERQREENKMNDFSRETNECRCNGH